METGEAEQTNGKSDKIAEQEIGGMRWGERESESERESERARTSVQQSARGYSAR